MSDEAPGTEALGDDAPRRGPVGARLANEVLRFVLELCLIVVAAWWGWFIGSSTLESLTLAVLVPLGVCVVWGAFAAPRRPYRTPAWFPSAMFLVLTALAVGALVQIGHLTLALVFGTVAVVNEVLLQAGLRTENRHLPRG